MNLLTSKSFRRLLNVLRRINIVRIGDNCIRKVFAENILNKIGYVDQSKKEPNNVNFQSGSVRTESLWMVILRKLFEIDLLNLLPFRKRKPGEVSAYSVFNPGCQRLLSQQKSRNIAYIFICDKLYYWYIKLVY
uniref:SAYSvFN domain-containing protein n=1 Tax=Syphacia muris TaxID=451379 RepID=A0A0N5AGA9_9BILA